MRKLLIVAFCLLFVGCYAEKTATSTAPTVTSAAETAPFTAPEPTFTVVPEPENEALVRVRDYIPTIQVELKYATSDNFTGQIIYGFSDAYLRYGTVKKLEKVQDFLVSQGLSLKIWDAFRPVSAQWALWEAYPDGNFVADPNTTYSAHSRGNTLDLTLVDKNGEELQMPSYFDDFSALADRDYTDCDLVSAENARLLQSILEQNGFSGYQKEWWHFTDTDSYEVEVEFTP